MASILFICTHNSARSQMAEGLLRELLPNAEVFSAGTHPSGVNPFATEAMSLRGVDISTHTSDNTELFTDRPLDYVVTVCDSAKESCPYMPALIANIHHSFLDPSATEGSDGDKLNAFVTVRDEIESWLRNELLPRIAKSHDALP